MLELGLLGFIVFLGIIWVLQETTKARILRYVILFIGEIYHAIRFPFFLVQIPSILQTLNCFFDFKLAGVMNSLFSVYGMAF